MRRHLYLQLYVALLAVTAASLLAAALAFRAFHEPGGPPGRYLRAAARMAMRSLPPPRSPHFEESLRRVANDLGVDILVLGPDGSVWGDAAQSPWPAVTELRPGWFRGSTGLGFVVDLERGARVAIRDRGHPRGGPNFAIVLAVVAVGMALGCYPIAKTITRRLEALDRGVKRWGQGELNVRLDVHGNDEVAHLTSSFNQAATRIESLVNQQRDMLANASHELRSPLTRLRMALELISELPDAADRQRLIDKATADIVELDTLVEEVLMVSRADAQIQRRPFESVDLTQLVRAETARVNAAMDAPAETVVVQGDEPMLRHLTRNLLENAMAHGEGRDVKASVSRHDQRVWLVVEDAGPGIPESERDKIFAPFYRPRASVSAGKPGTGLGLALVQRVARHHRGDVRHVAREGGGSRFEVWLPEA